jgi:GNAT acetyltransferase-like protein
MTETIRFREGVSADRDAVLALRRIAFPDSSPDMLDPDFWRWKFRDGYAGETSFFVAETDDGLVGHLAFVPQRYTAPEPIRGAFTVDAMTHPQFRGRQIYSRLVALAGERLQTRFDVFTAFQIRPHVLGGAVAAGWRPIARIPVLLRPLSLRGLARDFGLPLGGPPIGEAEHRDPSIRAIQPDELEQIDALLATPSIRQRRTIEFIRWRYLQNPRWHYELEGFFEGTSLRAFVIHRETTLRGLRTLAFADVGFLAGSETALRQLVRHVLQNGRRRGIGLAAAFLTEGHPAYGAVRARGFVRGPHRFNFLLNMSDPAAVTWTKERPWSMSWGDTDHL